MPQKANVLIVDDEPLIAMMIADWVDDFGCSPVGPVGTAPAAASLIEQGGLHAVLLDVTLGSGNSFDLADLARQKGVAVGFITGRSAGDLPDRFRGTPVLGKPFEYKAFEALLTKLISNQPAAGGGP
jgi:DNA-binding response OmpR family regulator